MSENVLAKLFEHNNWANQVILKTCLELTDEALDAEPTTVTAGTIRSTLIHLVSAEYGYLRLLTLPLAERPERIDVAFDDLETCLQKSGEGMLALVQDPARSPASRLTTRDRHYVEPWVVLLQAINHATEHREQIKSMLTELGVAVPEIDGWDYGLTVRALVPIEK